MTTVATRRVQRAGPLPGVQGGVPLGIKRYGAERVGKTALA